MNDVPLSIFKVLNFILDGHMYFRDCKKRKKKKCMILDKLHNVLREALGFTCVEGNKDENDFAST